MIWSDHDTILTHGLQKFYANKEYTDLTIRCHEKEFGVHKLILRLFTDFFNEMDGLWIRVNIDSVHMDKILRFIYYGEVIVAYNEMEEFLAACKTLKIKLFQSPPPDVSEMEPRRRRLDEVYELNDFQLMCKICYRVFGEEKSLKKHVAQSCKSKTNFCTMCDAKFTSKIDLANHERVHTGEKPFQCEDCDKAFRTKLQWKTHHSFVHKGINFPCPQCDKVFMNSNLLKQHVGAKHDQIKNHACLHCGAHFAWKSVLSTHLKLKHGILPSGKRTRLRKKKTTANNAADPIATKEEKEELD